jgi:hypothetical protein
LEMRDGGVGCGGTGRKGGIPYDAEEVGEVAEMGAELAFVGVAGTAGFALSGARAGGFEPRFVFADARARDSGDHVLDFGLLTTDGTEGTEGFGLSVRQTSVLICGSL